MAAEKIRIAGLTGWTCASQKGLRHDLVLGRHPIE